MAVSEHYSWLKRIEEALLALEEHPQFGGPEFPWQDLQQGLRSRFAKPSLTLSHHVKGWMQAEQLMNGLGATLQIHSITVPAIDSCVYWIMGEQDLQELFIELLGGEESAAFFIEKEYLEGFQHYLGLEIVSQMNHLHFASDLSFQIGDIFHDLKELVKDQACFVIDVEMHFETRRVSGRLLLPAAFREAWKTHYAQMKHPPISKEIAQKISVDVALEAGRSHLKWSEWKKIHVGDFLVLDQCLIEPEKKTGDLILSVEGNPLFYATLNKSGIKLQEYPFYEKAEASMDKEEEEFEEDEDEDLYEKLDEEDEEEDFEAMLRKASLKREEKVEIEEEEDDEVEEKEETIKPQKKVQQTLVSSEATSLTPEKLPIQLIVEVGRIRMTVEELMALSPGVLLEIPISPEQGVDLVINGKKVGRGELLKLGEILGVRILSL